MGNIKLGDISKSYTVLPMTVDLVLGILAILGAYGLTWYLLVKSTKIVNIIAREGLKDASEIRDRLKTKGLARKGR